MDGTQDLIWSKQESISLRHVDHNLIPQEAFIGFYEVSDTTGEHLDKVTFNVLVRLNMPLSGLQEYDGGIKGAQAKILEQQPLALFVHCGPHCVNLAAHAACKSLTLTCDALDWVHCLGCLYSLSGKFRNAFKEIAATRG